MQRILTCALLASICCLPACGHKPAQIVESKPGRCNYSRTLERWTRHQFIYDGFLLKFFVYGTLKNMEFRVCYAEEIARRKAISAADFIELQEAERATDAQYIEIVLGVYTAERKHNDFATTDSIWHLSAKDAAGKDLPLLTIQSLPVTSHSEILYPYLERWYQPYMVRFAKQGADLSSFALHIDGLLGSATLTW